MDELVTEESETLLRQPRHLSTLDAISYTDFPVPMAKTDKCLRLFSPECGYPHMKSAGLARSVVRKNCREEGRGPVLLAAVIIFSASALIKTEN
jgi:hypothetical protein